MSGSSASPSRPFGVDIACDRDEALVTVRGELDLASADLLGHEVAGLHGAGHDRVVVDLRQVEFMDSTGLRVLIGLHQNAERDRRQITLVPGPRQVQRVFELTETGALFYWRR